MDAIEAPLSAFLKMNLTHLDSGEQLNALWTLLKLKASADSFFGNQVFGRDVVALQLRIGLNLSELGF
jgi:hypothetical protein